MAPKIIYEDADFLAVNKPAGLLVHRVSGKRGEDETLTSWLLSRYPEIKRVGDDPEARPGIVHRLDREASGVLLVAKNQDTFHYLKSLFKTRAITKIYLAWVRGRVLPRRGAVESPIGMVRGTLKRSLRGALMRKEAVTEYRVIEHAGEGAGGSFSFLEVRPRTGRTHQIRVHLQSIGHPIVGDRLYGPKSQPAWATRLMLHAFSLEFTTRQGERLKIEAEPDTGFVRPRLGIDGSVEAA